MSVIENHEKALSSLNKMILINSIKSSEGLIEEYNVSGGISLVGTNGTNKTTILRAPLFFYGCTLDSIDKIIKKESKAVDWYFPTFSSYMVFPFVSEGRPIMAILSRKKNGSELDYQFSEGEFHPDLFISSMGDERAKIVNKDDLRTHFKAHGRSLSRQLSASQYRSVLQSNQKTRQRKKTGDFDLNEYRTRYSICPRNESIEGVEKLLISILSGSSNINGIKRSLAQNIQDTTDTLKQNIVNRASQISDFKKEVSLIDQARKFQGQSENIERLHVLKGAFEERGKQLSVLKSEIDVALKSLQENLEENQGKIDSSDEDIRKTNADFEVKSRAVTQEIVSFQTKIDHFSILVNEIEQENSEFAKQDIETKRLSASKIPELIAAKRDLGEILDKLNGEYSRITEVYKRALDDFKKRAEQRLNNERERVDLAKLRNTEQLSYQHKVTEKELDELSDKKDAESKEIQKTIDDLNEQNTAAKISLSNPKSADYDRLSSQVETIEEGKALKAKDLSNLQITKAQSQNKVDSLKLEQSKAANRIQDIEDKIAKLEEASVQKQKDLEKVENMLFFKVHKIDPKRAEMLSRVLRKDVLKSEVDELSISDSSNSIYGIDVPPFDFEAEIPESKEIIIADIKKIEVELQQSHSERKMLSEKLEKIGIELSEWNLKIASMNQDIKKLDQEISDMNSELDRTKKQLNAEGIRITNAKKDEISAIESKIEKQKSELNSLSEKFKSRKSELQASRDKAVENLKTELNALIDGWNNYRSTYESEIESKEVDTEREIQEALSKEKADTNAIKNAEENVRKNASELSKAESDNDFMNDYKNWEKERYSKLPAYQTDLASNKKSLNNAEDKKANLEKEHSEKVSTLNEALKMLKAEKTSIESGIKTLIKASEYPQVVESLPNKTVRFEVNRPANEIHQSTKACIKERSDFSEEAKHKLLSIRASIRNLPVLAEYAREFFDKEGLSGFDNSDVHWTETSHSLNRFLTGTLKNTLEGLRSNMFLLVDHLSDINAGLDQIHKGITKSGNTINKHAADMANYFESLGKLDVKVTSTINAKVAVKRVLERALPILEKYRRSGSDLDDEFFTQALKSMEGIEQDAVLAGGNFILEQFIEITVELTKPGKKTQRATTDEKIQAIDSNGFSLLIILMIYLATKRTLSHGKGTQVLWAIDESAVISPENLEIISRMIKGENIDLMSATPESNARVAQIFENHYKMRGDKGPLKMSPKQSNQDRFKAQIVKNIESNTEVA